MALEIEPELADLVEKERPSVRLAHRPWSLRHARVGVVGDIAEHRDLQSMAWSQRDYERGVRALPVRAFGV
jgi:hypothetical protein